MKPCRSCGGPKAPGTNSPYCGCRPSPSKADRQKAYRRRYPGKNKEVAARAHRKDPRRKILNAARFRAKSNGLTFNLDIDDIKIPEVCPVLGIPLDSFTGSSVGGGANVSIDRDNPKLGYVKGNVVIMSWRANRLKCDGTLEEFRKLLAYLEQNGRYRA